MTKLSLGEFDFESVYDAKRYFQNLLTLWPGSYLSGSEFEVVLDSIKRRSDAQEVIGCGVQEITVEAGMGIERHFRVHRKDGTRADIGYHNGLRIRPKSTRDRIYKAARGVSSRITNGDLAFPCGKPQGAEVHHVVPFVKVVDGFMEYSKLSDEDVKVVHRDSEYFRTHVFADAKLTDLFLSYYRQCAILRLMSVKEHRLETARQRASGEI